ncbi:MAG: hypothetical protein MJH10_17495, partial [Epibacterium sp.]|nr:hypothetical protein [Epibacterium sp.]NQX75302.1 hypothetical protein [Epibacterium sp.]
GVLSGGGLGSSFANLGGLLSGASGGFGAIGAALPALGVIAAAISFFGSKTKELDRGLRVTVDGLDSVIEQFRHLEKSRFWGLSKKRSFRYSAVDDETAGPLEAQVASIGASVVDLADMLGLAADGIENARYQFQVSTKGLSDEEVRAAFAEQFDLLADEFAGAVVGSFTETNIVDGAADVIRGQIADLERSFVNANDTDRWEDQNGARLAKLRRDLADVQSGVIGAGSEFVEQIERFNPAFEALMQEGEGAFDTLSRLATSLSAFNQAADMLNISGIDASISGGRQASEIVTASGGIEQFSASVSSYYAGFYSDQERHRELVQQTRRAMQDLGLALPETRDGFRALVEAQDLTTESGQRAWAALTGMSTAAAQLYSVREANQQQEQSLREQIWRLQGETGKLRARELEGLDETNRKLQERIWRIKDEAALNAQIAAEASALEGRLLKAQGNVVRLRELELAALDPSNRATLQRIWAIEDEKVATQAALAVASERSRLEGQLWKLMGRTDLLRARELEGLDASNRAMQEFIWSIEDQTQALSDAKAGLSAATDTLRDAFSASTDSIREAYALQIEAAQAARTELVSAAEIASANFDAARGLFDRSFDAETSRISSESQAQIDAINLVAEAVQASNAAAQDSARDRVGLLQGILSTLDGALDNRLALSDAAARMQRSSAQGFLRSAIAAGGTTDADGLSRAVSALSNPDRSLFSSFEDFAFDYKVNTGLMQSLQGITGTELSAAERTLAALQQNGQNSERLTRDQIRAIERQRDDQLSELQAIKDRVLGVDTSITDINSAISKFLSAQGEDAAAKAAITNSDRIIAALEQREQRDIAREEDRLSAILGGGSIMDVREAISSYYEAQRTFNEAEAASTASLMRAIDAQIEGTRDHLSKGLENQLSALTGIENSVSSVATAIQGYNAAATRVAAATSALLNARQGTVSAPDAGQLGLALYRPPFGGMAGERGSEPKYTPPPPIYSNADASRMQGPRAKDQEIIALLRQQLSEAQEQGARLREMQAEDRRRGQVQRQQLVEQMKTPQRGTR